MKKALSRATRASRNVRIVCAECSQAQCCCLDSWPLVCRVVPLIERLLADDDSPALRESLAAWLAETRQEDLELAAARRAPRKLRRTVAEIIGNGGDSLPVRRTEDVARFVLVSPNTVVAAKRWVAAGGLSRQVS